MSSLINVGVDRQLKGDRWFGDREEQSVIFIVHKLIASRSEFSDVQTTF